LKYKSFYKNDLKITSYSLNFVGQLAYNEAIANIEYAYKALKKIKNTCKEI